MEVKERIIDLRQYFLYLWEHIVIVILVAGLSACSLFCLKYVKEKKRVEGAKAEKAAFLEAEALKGEAVSKSDYTLDDLIDQNIKAGKDPENVANVFNVQPMGTYVVIKTLYVEYDFSDYEKLGSDDAATVIGKVQGDIINIFQSDTAEQTIIDSVMTEEDITIDRFKKLQLVGFAGLNLLRFRVIDVDEDRAVAIADELISEFMQSYKMLKTVKSVKIADDSDSVRVVTGKDIEERKEDVKIYDNGDVFIIPATTEEGEATVLKLRVQIPDVIKYGIIGGIAGLVLIMVIYLLIFIFKDAIRTSLDLNFAGLEQLGYVSGKNPEEAYKRIAYNISRMDKGSIVTVIPVDRYSEENGLSDKLSEELKAFGKKVKVLSGEQAYIDVTKNGDVKTGESDIVLIAPRNIKDYFDATLLAEKSDATIMNVTFGKTRMKNLLFAVNEVKKVDAKIEGAVICR